jgi:hypothetical protein
MVLIFALLSLDKFIFVKKTMRVKVFFYQVNEDFSPEYAEANHGGEATENNINYHWEDVLELKNEIQKIEQFPTSSYVLKGVFPDGNNFEFEIQNIFRFDLIGEDKTCTSIAFSENIYHNFELTEKDGNAEIHVFLKDYEVFANPIPGVYIYIKDFPKELTN